MRTLLQRRLPVLLVGILAGFTQGPAFGAEEVTGERLVFAVRYIASDYPLAVRDGRIVDGREFDEITGLANEILADYESLATGDSKAVREQISTLQRLIRTLAGVSEVTATTATLVRLLTSELGVAAAPVRTPDLVAGRALYAEHCARCHGEQGGGDGTDADGLDPPPTSFRDQRMLEISPHQVFGAITFGIEGTSMPSFAEALPEAARWDLAFFVLTQREDFSRGGLDPGLEVPLQAVAASSNADLVERLTRTGVDAHAADIDYYLLHPPPARRPEPAAAAAVVSAPAQPSTRPSPPSTPLDLALQLQAAFAAVADEAIPAVVGVTTFARETSQSAGQDASNGEGAGWRVKDSVSELYPGYRRLGSASGFVIDDDGYVLTTASVVTHAQGDLADAIDVESSDGQHFLARLVGVEPTINLALLEPERLRPEPLPPSTPLRAGSSADMKVGHWVIAVGDPLGPERSYDVGTFAAAPTRDCYQEELSATLIQASLRVHPEGYGGPLLDIRGRVVGMLVPPPPSADLPTRTSEYALPIELASNIAAALKTSETRRSPWLGVSVLDLGTARAQMRTRSDRKKLPRFGVCLDNVFDPSPAAAAGLRVDDCLTSIDGQPLLSVHHFQKWLYLSGVGTTVTIEVFRDGETFSWEAPVMERPRTATPR